MRGLLQMALNGVSSTATWDSTLRLSSSVGPYGETSFTWDDEDRPRTRSNSDGSKVEIEYSYAPAVTTERTGGRWTKSYLDGLGRPVRIEQGYGGKLKSGTRTPEVAESVVEKVYGPCACGPFGKLMRESLPRAIGDTAVYWNVYTYDDMGRIVNIKHGVADLNQPGVNQGETLYTYGVEMGSDVALATTKVVWPVTGSSQAQWKKTGTDGFGNLRRVWEPNPAGGEYVTDYSYNPIGQLTQVTMSRDGVRSSLPQTVTQTRSFEYDSYGRLKATVFPETGRTEYTYVNGRLDIRKNQLGEELQYVYDDKARLIKKQYRSSAQSPWQTASQMTYNAAGRPATISYSRSGLGTITETYTYTTVGQLQAKQLDFQPAVGSGYSPATPQVSWTYDAEGRVSVMTYPSGKKVRYKYDDKENNTQLTDPDTAEWMCALGTCAWVEQEVASATYDWAHRMTGMSAPGTSGFGFTSQAWTYNHLGQMTGYTLYPYSAGYVHPIHVSYNYGAMAAAGKLESMTRSQNTTVSTVNYGYDSLGRLTGATSVDWGQSFTYDGFGTLYKKIGAGSAAYVGTADWTGALDSAKNQVGAHNAVGNALSWGAAYDVENRLIAYRTESYLYDASNKRVMRTDTSISPGWYELTLWVGSMRVSVGAKNDVYIGGRRIAPQDRLGSNLGTGRTYLPYGEELNPTTNEADKFATYRRDASGLDYADQRYYSPGVGRFLTADPYMASAGAADPSSWESVRLCSR